MNRALVACRHCGFVARRYSYVGAAGRCPECRRPLEGITLTAARCLVSRRRAAEKRRSDEAKSAEVGLTNAPGTG
jgi:hypothetical protein